jgi:hypothetical protein
MYFKDFPEFLYDFKYGTQTKTSIVKDITRNVRIRKEILSNITLYDEYDIVDGETVEIIAEKVYGNPEYHWIIMLANDRISHICDFPLEEPALDSHIQNIYGNARYDIAFYEDERGFVVNSDYPGAVGVTNDTAERRLNEQKRRIKIIPLEVVNTILKEFKELL